MGRLSARSNPTSLKELDRNRVTLTISEAVGRRVAILERLDLRETGLAESLQVILVARHPERCRYGKHLPDGQIKQRLYLLQKLLPSLKHKGQAAKLLVLCIFLLCRRFFILQIHFIKKHWLDFY